METRTNYISKAGIDIIKQNISKEVFNIESIITYLENHDVITNEIFYELEMLNDYQKNQTKNYLTYYRNINRETFIKRIPIYFYDYINPYLKRNKEFRLKFLKAVYLNENVYTLEDVQTVVEYLEMQKENKILLADLEFRKLFERRLEDLDYREHLEYHCSGDDEKELHDFKVEANEMKILFENMRKGLTEILNTFTVGEKKQDDEPQTYYEYLCKQAMSGNGIIY